MLPPRFQELSESEHCRLVSLAGPALTYASVFDAAGRRRLVSDTARSALLYELAVVYTLSFGDMAVEPDRERLGRLFADLVNGRALQATYACGVVLGDGRSVAAATTLTTVRAPNSEAYVTGTTAVVDSRRISTPVLSPRRLAVLQLVAEGASTAEIADRLVLSRATVRNHLNAIFANLGAHSRLEAVAVARRLGLI